MYISFITDAYSHKIVGYSLSEHLDMHSSCRAMVMALTSLNGNHPGLIHHSDRGAQLRRWLISYLYKQTILESSKRLAVYSTIISII